MKKKLFKSRWDLVMWECDLAYPTAPRRRVFLLAGDLVWFFGSFLAHFSIDEVAVFFHLKSGTWLSINLWGVENTKDNFCLLGLNQVD